MGDGSGWRSTPTVRSSTPGPTYHIVATYDGTNARIYLNGALVSTSPNVTMAPNNGANVMRFGAYSTGPGQYWPGNARRGELLLSGAHAGAGAGPLPGRDRQPGDVGRDGRRRPRPTRRR